MHAMSNLYNWQIALPRVLHSIFRFFSGPSVKPQQVDMVSAGYFQNLMNNTLEVPWRFTINR